MRIAMALLLVAACGSPDKPRPAEPEQAGTSENCAALCKASSPQSADYIKCLEGCPGPETTGDRTTEDE
jgi:hypothetical protein